MTISALPFMIFMKITFSSSIRATNIDDGGPKGAIGVQLFELRIHLLGHLAQLKPKPGPGALSWFICSIKMPGKSSQIAVIINYSLLFIYLSFKAHLSLQPKVHGYNMVQPVSEMGEGIELWNLLQN